MDQETRSEVTNVIEEAIIDGASARDLRRAIIDGIQAALNYNEACTYINKVLIPHT